MQSRVIKRVMTEPQLQAYQSEAKFMAFCGGYGVGKSQTLVNCAIRDGLHSSNALIALYEPTYDLVRLILAPRMQEALTEFGISYKYNKQENIIYTSSGQCGDFVMRTMENPERIVGYESYRAHIDELDTLKRDQAAAVWNKIIARNRQKPKGMEDPFNRVSVYTTPEGFRFVYEKWVRDQKPGYELITASTYSNPFLPDDYIQGLKDAYPAGLIDAYIEGKFTNLTSGSVYPDFDRKLNHVNEFIREREPLHIGMDFNRLKMSAVVYVMRDGWPIVVEEVVDGRDTPYMAKLFNDRYVSKGHPVQVYPDASGQNSSSKNASESDLTILRQAGLTVRVNGTNPAVQDRVNSVNALILNGEGERKLKINTHACPKLTESLEQQAYDKNGQPDKSSGLDHMCFSGDTLVQTRKGIVRFDELPENGEVLGPHGEYVKYTNAGKIGRAKTIKITFAGGYTVESTEDHLFLTENGEWIQAKDLASKSCVSLMTRSKSSWGLTTSCAESIFNALKTMVKKGCTGLYGLITMAKSLMGFTSITRTTIGQTIAWKTSNACMDQSMHLITEKTLREKRACLKLQTSTDTLHLSGTNLKMVERGTENTMKNMEESCYMNGGYRTVLAVVKNLWQLCLNYLASRDTALIHAKQGQDMRAELTTLLSNAQNAGATSCTINTRSVRSVTSAAQSEEVDVYCLTVPGYGCFKLTHDSPIVSNCDAAGYPLAYLYPIKRRSQGMRRIAGL